MLYNDFAFELEHEVIDSALRIREVLTDAIQRLGEDSKAAPAMRAMRVAARQFLNRPRDRGMYLVSGDLGRLRALFGLQIAFLAIQYGIDLEDELASIVPPELAGLIDDGTEQIRLRPPRR